MIVESFGRYSTATNFIPLFIEYKPEFKPLEIKRLYYEDKEAKAQESTSGAGNEAQSGITPQDQQATSQETE